MAAPLSEARPNGAVAAKREIQIEAKKDSRNLAKGFYGAPRNSFD